MRGRAPAGARSSRTQLVLATTHTLQHPKLQPEHKDADQSRCQAVGANARSQSPPRAPPSCRRRASRSGNRSSRRKVPVPPPRYPRAAGRAYRITNVQFAFASLLPPLPLPLLGDAGRAPFSRATRVPAGVARLPWTTLVLFLPQ